MTLAGSSLTYWSHLPDGKDVIRFAWLHGSARPMMWTRLHSRAHVMRRLDQTVTGWSTSSRLSARHLMTLAAAVSLAQWPSALVLLAAVALLVTTMRRERSREPARRERDLLSSLLEELARDLRSGESLRTAVLSRCSNSEFDELLAPVGAELETGVSLADAVAAWAGPACDSTRRMVAAALSLGTTAGGPQAMALDSVSSTIREREAVAREASALGAQARASAVVLAVAPFCFGVLASAAEPETARFLFAETGGAWCLATGLLLQIGGWLWMRRIAGILR